MLQSMMSFTATEVHECASELQYMYLVPLYVHYISVLILAVCSRILTGNPACPPLDLTANV